MGKSFDCIEPDLRTFVEAQPVFFVASAPLAASGHVNVSPKGLDSFRVLSPSRVAYLDSVGSGNETAAHIAENGRLTFMFCAFTGAPRIVRIYCTGAVALPGSPEWNALRDLFPERPGARQIVVGEVSEVRVSCGYGVPVMDLKGERDTLPRWAEAQGADNLRAYQHEKNRVSLDGLAAPRTAGSGE